MSVKDSLLATLMAGVEFSVAQAQSWFNITNVTARIHELRNDGYSIYTNVRRTHDGGTRFVYRLGTPSRSMRAAARARGVRLKTV
jgi:hypothetical protein